MESKGLPCFACRTVNISLYYYKVLILLNLTLKTPSDGSGRPLWTASNEAKRKANYWLSFLMLKSKANIIPGLYSITPMVNRGVDAFWGTLALSQIEFG